jgi:hypothetical protein
VCLELALNVRDFAVFSEVSDLVGLVGAEDTKLSGFVGVGGGCLFGAPTGDLVRVLLFAGVARVADGVGAGVATVAGVAITSSAALFDTI